MARKEAESTEMTVTEKGKLGKTGVTDEENKLYLAHAIAPMERKAVDLLNPAEVEERVLAYAASCAEKNMRMHPPGMAAWLGVSQKDFTEWLSGMGSVENRALASRVHQMLHQSYADYALAGKTSPQLAIFFGQNWFGYTNKNALELQQATQAPPSLDKLAAEAAALPDGEVVDVPFVEIESGGKKQKEKEAKKKK